MRWAVCRLDAEEIEEVLVAFRHMVMSSSLGETPPGRLVE